MKPKQILGIAGAIFFIAIIVIISIVFVKNFNFIINDPSGVRDVIQRYGIMAYLLYFLLYIFQIFFAPVPGQVLNVASGMLFGTFCGFLISWLAVIVGGFLAMLLARFLGKKILHWFLEDRAMKFENEITRRGLPLIIFLAIFPNPIGDGLFYLAGLTNIPLKILILIIGICKIPGILIYVIAGNKIMSAGVKGWIIGGIGFLLAIVFYLICRGKFELIIEKYINKLNLGT